MAGAYAERLPVIFVASGYNTNDAGENHILHHSLGTHDFFYQYEMFRYVTCAAVRIVHPDDAPSMIDHAIRTALRERKPAYIEIACNLSDAPCPEPGPYEASRLAEATNPQALTAAVDRAPPFWRTRRSRSCWPGRTCAPTAPSTRSATSPRHSAAPWR